MEMPSLYLTPLFFSFCALPPPLLLCEPADAFHNHWCVDESLIYFPTREVLQLGQRLNPALQEKSWVDDGLIEPAVRPYARSLTCGKEKKSTLSCSAVVARTRPCGGLNVEPSC